MPKVVQGTCANCKAADTRVLARYRLCPTCYRTPAVRAKHRPAGAGPRKRDLTSHKPVRPPGPAKKVAYSPPAGVQQPPKIETKVEVYDAPKPAKAEKPPAPRKTNRRPSGFAREPTEEELDALIAERRKPENLPKWWRDDVERMFGKTPTEKDED